MSVTTQPPARPRSPLRLRLSDRFGSSTLDGGWWPQSRDLGVELLDLVDHFPRDRGRIVRALVSPPDWDSPPRQVRVARGWVKTGSFPRDDTHLIVLTTANRERLQVLVVPPSMTQEQGSEALLAAATRGNSHPADELLDEVSDQPPTVPGDHWSDDGGHYWGTGGAPSERLSG